MLQNIKIIRKKFIWHERERERENSLKRVYKKNGIENFTTYYIKKKKVHCICAIPSPQTLCYLCPQNLQLYYQKLASEHALTCVLKDSSIF